MRVFAIAVVACGCFHPSPPAGIPCGATGECPGEQVCDTSLSPPTCVESGRDAGTDDGDTSGVDALPPGACIADGDCDNGVCHELTGACIPDAEALFVAMNGAGTACTRAAPCGTLQAAIDARTNTRFMIALAAGTYASSWDTNLTHAAVTKMIISGPKRGWDDVVINTSAQNRVHDQIIAVFEGVTIRGGGGNAAGNGVDSRGNTTLARVWIDKAGDNGAELRTGTLRVSESKITNSTANGIYAGAGTLVVERTQISANETYGIDADGVSYTIVNSIITGNGPLLMQGGGVHLQRIDGGNAVFRFNTLANNQGIMYPSVNCEEDATIASSIIGESSFIAPVISPQCSATYSLFNTMAGGAPAGTGNIAGDPMFLSATDFHIQAGSPAINKANPNGAEPIDIDGQQRVAPPDIGADERP